MATQLTSGDPEPPIGAVVIDFEGLRWRRWGVYWLREDRDPDEAEPESWNKVAGNYGPVTLVE